MGAGVLIEGPSGSGKTSLALGLVDTRGGARAASAALVGDDQAMLEARAGRLVAARRRRFAGLAEIARPWHRAVSRRQPACAIEPGRPAGRRTSAVARMPETASEQR